MEEHLEDISENSAAAWLAQAGFTATAVQRDRHGWDQLIEFAAPCPNTLGPLGLDSIDFTAKLQVKATRGDRRQIPVKLSNWKRAIEDVLPWFFLCVRRFPSHTSGSAAKNSTVAHLRERQS